MGKMPFPARGKPPAKFAVAPSKNVAPPGNPTAMKVKAFPAKTPKKLGHARDQGI